MTAVLALVALAVAVVAIVITFNDDDDVVTASSTTSAETTVAEPTTTVAETTVIPTTIPTTVGETTTQAPTTSTTAAPSTTSVVDNVDVTVFPPRESELRFDDPLVAVEQFVVGYVGYQDPILSEFRQGDARSGEVGVRPAADGPETTVLVRQLDDGNWWILGAVAENIVIDQPVALATITSPLTLKGRTGAFDGSLDAELWTDGADEPLALATLSPGEAEPHLFEAALEFAPPATKQGALVIRSRAAEHGRVREAAVMALRF